MEQCDGCWRESLDQQGLNRRSAHWLHHSQSIEQHRILPLLVSTSHLGVRFCMFSWLVADGHMHMSSMTWQYVEIDNSDAWNNPKICLIIRLFCSEKHFKLGHARSPTLWKSVPISKSASTYHQFICSFPSSVVWLHQQVAAHRRWKVKIYTILGGDQSGQENPILFVFCSLKRPLEFELCSNWLIAFSLYSGGKHICSLWI